MSVLAMVEAAGGSAIDTGLGMVSQGYQAKLNREQAAYTHQLQKKMFDYTYNKTNTTAQMQQLKANNLNPTLLYGKGGGGGTTTPTTGSASADGVGMVQPSGVGRNLEAVLAMKSMQSQIDLNNANAKKAEADAAKTSGIDTEVAKGTLAKIIAETTNENAKTGLIEIQKSLGEIDILESGMSRYDRMTKINLETKNAVQELNRLTRENAIGDETKNDIVTQIKLQTIGARLDNELKRANINLTAAQINSLREQIRLGWFGAGSKLRELEQGDRKLTIEEFNAKADAIYKGASTVLGRVANDIIYDVSTEVDKELK